ncbi:SPOC like C-terminal domain-containing protein [Hyaloraphidium curvatum]|nr:SPOC like C-terminal domain-containing protein [Hyaloraphidium curvatum]
MDFDDAERGFKEEDKPQMKVWSKRLHQSTCHLTLPPQADNEQSIRDFCEKYGQSIFTVGEAAKYITAIKTKEVRPTTVFRGALTLGEPATPVSAEDEDDPDVVPAGQGLSIAVHAYNKTSELKVLAAKKFSARSRQIHGQPVSGGVSILRSFQTVPPEAEEDQAKEEPQEVDQSDVTRAYRYGSRLVPINEADQEGGKLRTIQGLWILGSVFPDDVPRHYYHGQTMQVQADPGDTWSCLAFSALCGALVETDMLLLVRLVTKDDRAPKIGVLVGRGEIEDLGAKQRMMFVQLPYAQDIRHYSFTSLDTILKEPDQRPRKRRHKYDTRQQPTEEVEDAMDQWIEAMDLSSAGPNGAEAFRSRDTFSPLYHRVYQCIAARALDPDGPLPPPDPAWAKGMEPLAHLLESSEEAFDELKRMFKPPVKVIKAAKKRRDKDRAVWMAKDDEVPENPRGRYGPYGEYDADDVEMLAGGGVRADEDGDVRMEATQSQPGLRNAPEPVRGLEMRSLLGPKFTDRIHNETPLEDFHAMLERRDVDYVPQAVGMMANVILQLIRNGTGQSLTLAINCLEVLRKAVIEEDEVRPFNKFMRELKEVALDPKRPRTSRFWVTYLKEYNDNAGDKPKLMPVTLDEHHEGVTAEEARSWLEDPLEPEVVLLNEVEPAKPQKKAASEKPAPEKAAAPGKRKASPEPARPADKRKAADESSQPRGAGSKKRIVLEDSEDSEESEVDASFAPKKTGKPPPAKPPVAKPPAAPSKGPVSPAKSPAKSSAPVSQSQRSQRPTHKSVFAQDSEDEDDE